MANILCTGSCGYVGTVLVPKLLSLGHTVIGYDLEWFGKPVSMLSIKKDFRDITEAEISANKFDTVIHLAGIANDPTGDLNPKLTWETNALGTAEFAARAARCNIDQFIYASSGSVYGVNENPEIREQTPLVPLSEYNKTKMVAERVLLSYQHQMAVQIIRPATVCGLSPRQRLDVMVNSFCIKAMKKGEITFNGGEQFRPNIHIEDMANVYIWMLKNPQLTGIFNAGFENLQIKTIAEMVSKVTGAKIKAAPSTDPRSYRMNSDKLLAAGFKPRFGVLNAIYEMVESDMKDEDNAYNLITMKKLGF